MFVTGQKVVCIDDKAPMWIKQLYTQWIQEGLTYVVRGVTVGISFSDSNQPQEGEICVYLVGVVNPTSEKAPFRERGFNAMRFRPLDELTTDEIMQQSEPDLIGKEYHGETHTF